MKATTWRRAAPVTAALLLSAGSAVPLAGNAAPLAGPANYGALVGNTVRSFNGYAAYSNFEISDPRWVHASTGWNWLTCVRYYDRGQRRTYVFFIDNGAVVASRYSVLSDQCGAQQIPAARRHNRHHYGANAGSRAAVVANGDPAAADLLN